ncbi:MAG TPA: glycosyltransferase family 4 protein, partial [Gemmatimonadaceae bacterium]|nr:glycosyltransferase family 4 protein [Gemmatimonadaceae bacterium]
DADDSALATSTTYLAPRSRRARVGWLLRVAARRPATVARVAAFTAATRYALEKSVASDLATFWRAVDVAMTMQALGVNHVHAPWSNVNAFVLLLASRLLGVSCSVHARAHDLHRDDSAFALREKFLAAHFVVTNTRYNVEGIRALLPPARHDKVHLVRNGLDVERYGAVPASAPPPAEAPRGSAPYRLLCVARLIEPKGLDVLLEACAILRDRGIAFACDIVGGPEEPLYTGYLARLRVLHHRLQLQSHVRFAGALPHSAVVRHYQRADLFVLPCVVAANGSRDITPNALIEAMAMRLPVIATTITAIPEIVANGTSGVLVPPGDAGALADAIERLLADEALRRRLGEEARRTVERTFDLHRNMAEYAHLFRATC